MRKKKEEVKPLTISDIKTALADILEFLEMDAQTFAREFTPDVNTKNEAILRIYTDGKKIEKTKASLNALVGLIEKENGAE